MPYVNQTELAQLLGVSKPYIHKLVAKGILALNADGQLDVDASVAAIKAVAVPGHQQRHQSAADTPLMTEIRNSAIQAAADPNQPETPTPDPDAAPNNYQQARAMREKFAAMNERLKFQKLTGELIPAALVEEQYTALIMACKTELLLIPDRLTATLKALYGIDVDLDLIEQPINEALIRLSNQPAEASE